MDINKREFLKALMTVTPFVAKRSTIPIVAGVLVNSEKGQLSFTCTDLEKRASITVNYSGPDFRFVADANLLPKIVKFVKSDTFTLTIKHQEHGDRIVIKDGTYKAELPCLVADDYPLKLKYKTDTTIEIDARMLSTALIFAGQAAPSDDSRKVLRSVNINVLGGHINIVATDGKRCHIAQIPTDSGDSEPLLIPVSTIGALNSALRERSGPITIEWGDKDCVFNLGDLEISSKIVEGSYPNYRQIIPPAFATTVQIDCNEFVQTFNAVIAVLDDMKAQFVEVDIGEDMTLQVKTQKGIMKASLKIDEPLSDSIKINFAPGVLLSSIPACKLLAIDFNDSFSPVRFRPAGNSSIYSIVMPMRNK